jgi:hypothetical protein
MAESARRDMYRLASIAGLEEHTQVAAAARPFTCSWECLTPLRWRWGVITSMGTVIKIAESNIGRARRALSTL